MKSNYQYFMKVNVKPYIGKWIAISDEKIIASSSDVKKVYKIAKKAAPKKVPFIVKVPSRQAMIF